MMSLVRAFLAHQDTLSTTMIRLTTSAPKRLPKELWEHIIDHCVPPSLDLYSEKHALRYSIFESTITFLACALTCREWLARSLVNLYSVCIILEDYKSVDRLVEIITMRPHLAPFVRTLWVSPEAVIYPGSHLGHPLEQYIPFVRTELIHRLTNLHTIAYLGPYWWPYPAVYNLHIARYRSLKTLYLACWFRSPTEMFRLIWTLEKLQDLHLHSVQFDVYPQDSLDPTYERLRNLAIQKPRCKSLESLMINWSTEGVVPAIPYQCAFGTSVRQLGLSCHCTSLPKLCHAGSLISNYISSLPFMAEFSLWVHKDIWPLNPSQTPSLFVVETLVPWLRDTLNPQSCPSLRRMHLRFHIWAHPETGHLEGLIAPGHHLDDVCNRLPALRELLIQLDYIVQRSREGQRTRLFNPSNVGNVNEAIRAAMPKLKAKLLVVVNGQLFDDVAKRL